MESDANINGGGGGQDNAHDDIHVIDENVDTLVSNMDQGHGDVTGTSGFTLILQNHVAVDFRDITYGHNRDDGSSQVTDGFESMSKMASDEDQQNSSFGHSLEGDGTGGRGKKLAVLTDSSTHIISFQATGAGGEIDDENSTFSAADNSNNADFTSCQKPPETVAMLKESDTNNNVIVTNPNLAEPRGHEVEGKVVIEPAEQQVSESIDQEQGELEKCLELAKVELRPMSKPQEDQDTNDYSQQQNADDILDVNTQSQLEIECTPRQEDGNIADVTETPKTSTSGCSQTSADNREHSDKGNNTAKAQSGESTQLPEIITSCRDEQDLNGDLNKASQTRKTSDSDQCLNEKRINSKRINDLSKFQSQLIGIDEMSVDSRPSARGREQKTRDTVDQISGGGGSNTKTEPRSRVSTADKTRALGRANNTLLTKNIVDTGAALLITTPLTPVTPKSNNFTDERKSHQMNGNSDGGQGNRLSLDQLYNPYARTNSPRRAGSIRPHTAGGGSSRPPVSKFERPYTKTELQRALPRKSFFNCHERAMKDAGFEVDDPVAKRKAERLKAKLDRIAREFDPLPSKTAIETGKEPATNAVSDVKVVVTDVSNMESAKADNSLTDNIEDIATANDNVTGSEEGGDKIFQTAATSGKPGVGNLSKKRRPGSAKVEYVECKPLSVYLEYIKENNHEYLQHTQALRSGEQGKPNARLIKLGRAFELRHQGGTPRVHGEDVVLMAAKALRPRTADPAKFSKPQKDRTGLWTPDTMRQMRPQSDDKRQQEKSPTATGTTGNAGKEEDHPKTELERRKGRAEDWSRSVSTSMLTRAKIQSLRELGSDDQELTKWWEAFKGCHYLRHSHTQAS